MGRLLNVFTPLHKRTIRDFIGRMTDDKVACMAKAKQYGFDYWDGDRRYGYGGYRYDGRWKPVAERLIDIYGLTETSAILDVGCGKAHLLHEIKALLPGARVAGFDLSAHGIADAPEAIRPYLFLHKAEAPYPYDDETFDLVLSLGCLHNLRVFELKSALSEIERVGGQKFVMMESYRNDQELFNLQCWALTCESFFDPDEWVWLFQEFGYCGDYEFIYFEA
jgi:SAM-dependent methyltransferase